MKAAGSLHELCAAYGKQVEFLLVYIREAHPIDGWYLGKHDIRDPRDLGERGKVASRCEASLALGIRTCVDEMDDTVMKAYAAWPDRLYLVDTGGRIAYAGPSGPFGFRPGKLRKAIESVLAGQGRPGEKGCEP